MYLFLMRHGEAGYDAITDELRSLTPNGRFRLKAMLHEHVELFNSVDCIVHSPYLRTTQTAEMVLDVHQVPVYESDLLVPEASPQAVIDWLQENQGERDLLLVTHQPLVGNLVSLLCEGDLSRPEPMLPGALAVIEYDFVAEGLGVLKKVL